MTATRVGPLPRTGRAGPAAARGRAFAVATIVWAMLGAGAIAGAPADLRIGFNGVYRTGAWTPLVVSGSFVAAAAAAGRPLAIWTEDPDGQFLRTPPAQVATDGEGGSVARFSVRFGRPGGDVLLEAVGPDGGSERTPLALPPPLAAHETVLLVLGDLPAADRAARLLVREDGSRPRVVSVADPRGIAADAAGIAPRDFDGVDAVVVCGTAILRASGADDRLLKGILDGVDGWVRRGGRLVFIAGATATELVANQSSAAGWLPGPVGRPGSISRLVPLRRSVAIETFARAGRPLEKGALSGLQVPLLADAAAIDGTIEAFEGNSPTDLPLVVRSGHGFGTITWIGLDIDQGGFRTWQGSDSLLVELLGARGRAGATGRAGESRGAAFDMAGQLRTALDQFPEVSAIPFELIALLGILYVACLYPLDWWIASRSGRPAIAWFSLPLLVALFSGLAWATAGRWKSDAWKHSQADVVDIDAASGFVRGSSYYGIWSPANARIDAAAAPAVASAADAADVAVSWFGNAGRGIGSTDAAAAHPSLAAADYAYAGSLAAIDGIPIAAASSRLFEAEWTGRWKAAEPAVVSSLGREGQGTLKGTLESRLPFPLDGCVLAHAGWLYEVGRLAPGDRFDPQAGRGPRSLAGAITRRSTVQDRDVAVRWDVESRDIDRILEIAGFHAAAGGSAYTALEAGRLGRLDLSPLLSVDRAVLVGRGPAGTAWRLAAGADGPGGDSDAAASTAGIWRIVIPIE